MVSAPFVGMRILRGFAPFVGMRIRRGFAPSVGMHILCGFAPFVGMRILYGRVHPSWVCRDCGESDKMALV